MLARLDRATTATLGAVQVIEGQAECIGKIGGFLEKLSLSRQPQVEAGLNEVFAKARVSLSAEQSAKLPLVCFTGGDAARPTSFGLCLENGMAKIEVRGKAPDGGTDVIRLNRRAWEGAQGLHGKAALDHVLEMLEQVERAVSAEAHKLDVTAR